MVDSMFKFCDPCIDKIRKILMLRAEEIGL